MYVMFQMCTNVILIDCELCKLLKNEFYHYLYCASSGRAYPDRRDDRWAIAPPPLPCDLICSSVL